MKGGFGRAGTAQDLTLAGLTIVGVPTVTALLGGGVGYAGTVPLAVLLAGLLLLRRSWPVTVLAASVAAVIGYRMAGLTDVGWMWPASAAFFTVAALPGRRCAWWAAGTAGAALWLAAVWEPTGAQRLTEVGAEALWLALIFAAARAYRNRQGWQAETAARLAHQERLLMARELHDVVAHTLTVVGLQLRVADEALDDSPEEAREALRLAQQVRATAVRDLRDFLDLLRSGPSLAPTGDVRAIVAHFASAHLTVEGNEDSVPAPVGLAVYRLVQEGLTNAVKHAQADRIDVRLNYQHAQVQVDISDDGRGPSRTGGPGHGLAGMRERVAALGGTFHAGPRAQGGFRVSAMIPMARS